MAVIPDGYLDLLEKKITFANLATVLKDGSPQVTPIWFDYTGGKIRINTARGRVKTGDVDAAGHFALGAIVLRFSNASGQLGAAIGMDSAFMQQQRRGFSTFELILHVSGVLRLDAPYLVETGIGHLGSSSLRMIHRMTDARTGVEVARLSQFGVNLDLDARRPARWPDAIRERAAALVVPENR